MRTFSSIAATMALIASLIGLGLAATMPPAWAPALGGANALLLAALLWIPSDD